MKAILVIDLPNDLDISLDEYKADITMLSKDFSKSMLSHKYKNIALKNLPQKKNVDEDLAKYCEDYDRKIGWNECIDEILGEQ